MRSEKFHTAKEKAAPVVVDECSRLTVLGTESVNVYQVDEQGKKVRLLHVINGKDKIKLKLHKIMTQSTT